MFIQDFHISVEEISLSKFCCHPSNKDYRHAKIIHAYGKDKFWNSDKLKRQFPEWVENNNLWENKRNHRKELYYIWKEQEIKIMMSLS